MRPLDLKKTRTREEKRAFRPNREDRTMTDFIKTTVAAAALAVAGALPGFAASGDLDAYAAKHFNAGVSIADRQTEPGTVGGPIAGTVVLMTRGTAGGATADERAALHFNAGVSISDRQTVVPPVGAADAGLDAYAAAHFNTGVAAQDRQTAPF
jgi:hypothetical protein